LVFNLLLDQIEREANEDLKVTGIQVLRELNIFEFKELLVLTLKLANTWLHSGWPARLNIQRAKDLASSRSFWSG